MRNNTTSVSASNSIGLGRESSGDFAKGGPNEARGFWLMSQPITNVTQETFNRLAGTVRLTGPKTGAPLKVKFSKPIIREVPDPRI